MRIWNLYEIYEKISEVVLNGEKAGTCSMLILNLTRDFRGRRAPLSRKLPLLSEGQSCDQVVLLISCVATTHGARGREMEFWSEISPGVQIDLSSRKGIHPRGKTDRADRRHDICLEDIDQWICHLCRKCRVQHGHKRSMCTCDMTSIDESVPLPLTPFLSYQSKTWLPNHTHKRWLDHRTLQIAIHYLCLVWIIFNYKEWTTGRPILSLQTSLSLPSKSTIRLKSKAPKESLDEAQLCPFQDNQVLPASTTSTPWACVSLKKISFLVCKGTVRSRIYRGYLIRLHFPRWPTPLEIRKVSTTKMARMRHVKGSLIVYFSPKCHMKFESQLLQVENPSRW